MRRFIAKKLLQPRLPALDSLIKTYAQFEDVKDITRIQCESFNAHWENAWRNIPFYTSWKNEHKLPEQIRCVKDLADFPILTKSALLDQNHLVERTPGIEGYTLTGGTSGASTAFPMNKEDAKRSWTNTHLGRHWNGINPGDRLFMIWGHSHLFSGKGARRKQFLRQLKDWAVNIDRMSAYNLSTKQLSIIADNIDRAGPTYVIGYGSCLVQLSHFLSDHGRVLSGTGIRRVVNTSESMAIADVKHIENVFGCPLINEYGSAEAGVIGYSEGLLYPVKLFWYDFITRFVDRRIVLTTLRDRCFPLINYDTEDLCDDPMPESGSVLMLHSLLGKARDIFTIQDVQGKNHNVSVVLFDHILKQIRHIRTLHYTLRIHGDVEINYTADEETMPNSDLQKFFMNGLAKEGIIISKKMVSFNRLSVPMQTIAGKRVTLKRDTL